MFIIELVVSGGVVLFCSLYTTTSITHIQSNEYVSNSVNQKVEFQLEDFF